MDHLTDKNLAEACLQLKHSDTLRPILEWFIQQRESCRTALETRNNVDELRVLQGEARAYKKFLELVDDVSSG